MSDGDATSTHGLFILEGLRAICEDSQLSTDVLAQYPG